MRNRLGNCCSIHLSDRPDQFRLASQPTYLSTLVRSFRALQFEPPEKQNGLRSWKRPNLSFNKVKAMDSMVGGSGGRHGKAGSQSQKPKPRRGGLQRQEVVRGAQVTEANSVDAEADDVGEVLKDRRQLQDGRLLT